MLYGEYELANKKLIQYCRNRLLNFPHHSKHKEVIELKKMLHSAKNNLSMKKYSKFP